MKKIINFDKNATTGTLKSVWETMQYYAVDEYGNPSSLYEFSNVSRNAIKESREIISGIINCDPSEIYFVASGSMGDNWIIHSLCGQGGKFVTTPIEHHAVLNMAENIPGLQVQYIPVDTDGVVHIDENTLTDTNLMSVMYINNEIGTIQDINSIGHICRSLGIPFHTDAVQAFGKIPIDVDAQCIDFMSVSGHKFHGPKGIGFVYVRDKYKNQLKPAIYGGGQQDGLIAGTENVPAIIGMARAAEIAYTRLEENSKQIKEVYWYLRSQLKINFNDIIFNNGKNNLENVVSACFINYGIHGEELLAFLSEHNICVSTGSACASHSNEVSHVLKAIGLSDDEAGATIRFSIDEFNTTDEVTEIIKVLKVGIDLLGRSQEL